MSSTVVLGLDAVIFPLQESLMSSGEFTSRIRWDEIGAVRSSNEDEGEAIKAVPRSP